MDNRWNADDERAFDGPVGACVYATRLIGSDPSLVLHGGGNSSVKAPFADITGRSVDALYVKGSGWDMATIEPAGLAPVDLARLHELLALERLSDPDMMRELTGACLDPAAPAPSVEALLHAFLPHPAVQHSHADAIVNLTNIADGEAVVRAVYDADVVVVPYVMPGFDLARAVRAAWPAQAHDETLGMVLLNHGLFTFGSTSAEAYQRHVDLITRAERWLDEHAPLVGGEAPPPLADPLLTDLADLRLALSQAAGAPMVVQRHADDVSRRFVSRPDLASIADRGPLTPDHVIRTKPTPMVGRDIDGYVDGYRAYVDEHRARARTELTEVDPAPRLVLDPALGMLAVGRTIGDAAIAADIYHHTMPVIMRAEDHLDGYQALSRSDLFDMEYWDLEQAKLRRAGPRPPFAGMVGLVTGAASGIGRACAAELLQRGACVVGLDRSPEVVGAFDAPAWTGVTVDVTDAPAQTAAVAQGVERYGGLDLVVVSAGLFGPSRPLADLDPVAWREIMSVNVDAVAALFAVVHPLLARSPVGGRVVVIGSKNVPAPGPGAAPYSASKAALTQLTRVAALEWAADGIRVNAVHPDAVFDTALWSDELIEERAARYGLSAEAYRRRNLLATEVTSAGVAEVVAELCSDTFSCTTGAQIPIDGGNERVV
jgi:rhamnose utilization protein RhaD (predicted bifunctional aldolase and dehydrogenase)/NAD(P)-dependent dehydrogenase (short-subunit alcohol dehydrogenase family)